MQNFSRYVAETKSSLVEVGRTVWREYGKEQSMKTKMIDAWLVYCVATAVVQFIYCMLVGTYPFNSFLAGFLCHVAMFALGVSLRLQYLTPGDFDSITSERAIADFMFCHLVLFFVVFSFMG
eukprot:GSChrysophyteH1.ASY1.ANO1.2107.1 assembled CDS